MFILEMDVVISCENVVTTNQIARNYATLIFTAVHPLNMIKECSLLGMLKCVIVNHNIYFRNVMKYVSQFIIMCILYMKVLYRHNIQYASRKYIKLLLLNSVQLGHRSAVDEESQVLLEHSY
jgi:hypothetical protein